MSLSKYIFILTSLYVYVLLGPDANAQLYSFSVPNYNAYYEAGEDVHLTGSVNLLDDQGNPAQNHTLDRVEIFIDNTYAGEASLNGFNWSYDFTPPDEGSYSTYLKFYASTDQGNEFSGFSETSYFYFGPKLIRINFQPPSEDFQIPNGYLADTGAVYGDRGNGFSYGWSHDLTDLTIGRTDNDNWLDQYYSLLLLPAGSDAFWELELPEGRYQVDLFLGDSEGLNSGTEPSKLIIEGQALDISNVFYSKDSEKLKLASTIVDVKDGRFTLSDASTNGIDLQLNYLVFRRLGPVGTPTNQYLGSGDTPIFKSSVLSLDRSVKGLPLHENLYDHPGTEVDESAYWFNRLFPASSPLSLYFEEMVGEYLFLYNPFHFQIENGGLRPMRIGGVDYSKSQELPLDRPAMAFGSAEGASRLYINETYKFGLNVGELLQSTDPAQENWARGLRILAYSKTDVDDVGSLPSPIIGILELPRPENPEDDDEWAAFLKNGFSKTIHLEGLKTTVEYAPGAWGNTVDFPLLVTHESSSNDYYYVIEVSGVIPDSNGPLSMGSSEDEYYPLYALSFVDPPSWRTAFIPKPSFEETPMPPGYSGKTLAEVFSSEANLHTIPLQSTDPEVDYLFSSDPDAPRSPELRRHPILDGFVQEMSMENITQEELALALSAFVHNEIELTDALDYGATGDAAKHSLNWGGLNRSALATYLEGQGSPMEQCALLVYLLRQANVPAAYVFPAEETTQLLDAQVSQMLGQQWKGALDYKADPSDFGDLINTDDPDSPRLIPANFPWVAVQVEIDGEPTWVHLFPWLKDYEIVEGYDLQDYMPDRYDRILEWIDQYCKFDWVANKDDNQYASIFNLVGLDKVDTPSVLFPRFVESILRRDHGQMAFNEIGVRRTLRRNTYANWKDFPEPFVVPNTELQEYSGLDDLNTPGVATGVFNTLHVRLLDDDSSTEHLNTGRLRVCDLHNRRFYLWWQDDQLHLTLGRFREDATNYDNPGSAVWSNSFNQSDSDTIPSLLDEQELRSGSLSAENYTIEVTYNAYAKQSIDSVYARENFPGFAGNKRFVRELKHRKGELGAICMNTGRSTLAMLDAHARDQLLYQGQDGSSWNDHRIHERWGNIAYMMGMNYYERVNHFGESLEDLLKVNVLGNFAVGMSKISPNFRSSSPSGELVVPNVDMFFRITGYAGTGNLHLEDALPSMLARNYIPLLLLDISAQEHEIINGFFDQDRDKTVSTVKLFHLAKILGRSIVELNHNNFEAEGNKTYREITTNEFIALKDFNSKIWQQITDAFEASPITRVYITPGPIYNDIDSFADSTFYGIGALILRDDGADALIGSANGAFGLPFYPGTTTPSGWSDTSLSKNAWSYSIQSEPISFSNPRIYTAGFDISGSSAYFWSTYESYMEFDFYSWESISSSSTKLGSSYVFDDMWEPGASGYSGTEVTDINQQIINLGFDTFGNTTSFYPDASDPLLVSDPVNILTGEFYIDTDDLTLPGPMPLSIRRNYSSVNDVYSPLGHGWKFSLVPHLAVLGEGAYDASTNAEKYEGYLIYGAEPNGSVIAYRRVDPTSSIWRPLPEDNEQMNNYNSGNIGGIHNPFHAYIEKDESSEPGQTLYWLHKPDGSKCKFRLRSFPIHGANDELILRERPYLDRHEDAFGNFFTFEFYGDEHEGLSNVAKAAAGKVIPEYGELKRIRSSNGNFLGVNYNVKRQLIEIYTHDGRRVHYAYDSSGDLVNVTLPDKSEIHYEYQSIRKENPDTIEYLTDAERLEAYGSEHGCVGRAWLIPPVTGNYRFSMSSWSAAYLYLSTDDTPINHSNVTRETVPGFVPDDGNVIASSLRRGIDDPSGSSKWFFLEAGKRYSIEAIQLGSEEDATDEEDFLQIFWEQEDGFQREVIKGQYLVPRTSSTILDPNAPTNGIRWEYYNDYFLFSEVYKFLKTIDLRASFQPSHLLSKVINPDGRVLENNYDPAYDPYNEAADDFSLRRVYQQHSTVGDDLNPVLIATYEYLDNWEGDNDYQVTKVYSETQPAHGRPVTTYVHRDKRLQFIADAQASSFSYTNRSVDHVLTYDWYEDNELTGGANAKTGSYQRSLERFIDKRGLETKYLYDTDGNPIEISVTGDLTGDGAADTSTSHIFYNARHLKTKVIAQAPGQTSNNHSQVTVYEYPSLNQADPEYSGYTEYTYLPKRIKQFAIENPLLDANLPASGLISTTTLLYGSADNGEPAGDLARVEAHGLLKVSSHQSALNPNDRSEVISTYDTRGYSLSTLTRTFRDADHNFIGTALSDPAANEITLLNAFEYNDRGELITQKDPAGRVTRFDYDAMGRLKWREHYKDSTAIVPLSWESLNYNQNGEVTWIDGPRHGAEDYIQRDYDGAGRMIAEVRWRTQAKADGSGIEAVPGQEDYLGQSITLYDYDGFGNLEAITDPLENVTSFLYDNLGQKTTTIFAGADAPEEEFLYEPGGQISVYTNTKNGQTTTLYTRAGQVKQRTYPDQRSESFKYYLDGRLKQQNLSNGTHVEYHYNDALLTVTTFLREGSAFGAGEILDQNLTRSDTRGNVVENQVYASESEIYAFESTFDGASRLLRSEGPDSGALDHPLTGETTSAQQVTTYHYAYDNQANTYTVTQTVDDVETVTVEDALGRTNSITVRKIGESADDVTTFEYDPQHHYVITKRGTNDATNQQVKSYTNVDGQNVLTEFKDGTYRMNKYDKAGNLLSATDEIGLSTGFTYDARNRLETTTRPDGSEVTLDYDGENNLIERVMPGDLTWSASYDSANRIDYEELTGNDSTSKSRHVDYQYYATGDHLGLLETRLEKANSAGTAIVTHDYTYDARNRLQQVTSTDSNAGDSQYYPAVEASYAYDFRSLPQSITRASPGTETDPILPTRVSFRYDGYGQLIEEMTEIGAAGSTLDSFNVESTHSQFVQHWDTLGRRGDLRLGKGSDLSADLFTTGFTPAGRLETASLGAAAVNYDYSDNGLQEEERLTVSGALRTTVTIDPLSGRDLRGRIRQRTTRDVNQNNLLAETLSYSDDSKITGCATVRGNGTGTHWGNFAETRDYTYDGLTRRLATETYLSDPLISSNPPRTLIYSFDEQGLGVRTQAEFQSSGAFWAVLNDVDTFYRIAQEGSNDSIRKIAVTGDQADTPALYSLWFDERKLSDLQPDEGGNWAAVVSMPHGSNLSIEARAEHLHPGLRQYNRQNDNVVTDTTTFDLASQADFINTDFDSMGRMTRRTWASGQAAQQFTWDAQGKLVKIVYTDTRASGAEPGYTWTANYDPLDRRIRSTIDYVDPDLGDPVVVESQYDPQVEFLEIALIVNGRRTWKLYGNDLSGGYGGLQGIGGLVATVDEVTGNITVMLDDASGHVVARMEEDSAEPVWNTLQMSGYGPHPRYEPLNLSQVTNPEEALIWQGRYVDPTGFYCMGARYYDYRGGRFISADPLGHAASMDLYSYANGDPVNFVDPTGRAAQLSSDNAGYVVGKSPGVDLGVMYDGGFSGQDYIRLGNAYFPTSEQAQEYLVRRWTNNFETEVKGGVTGLRNSPLFMAALVRVSVAQAFDFRERPGDSTLNALSFAVGGRGGPVRGPVITKPGPTGFVLVGNPKPVVVSKPPVVAPKALPTPKPTVKLTQQGLDHIVLRHFPSSGAKNAGKFSPGTTVRDLKNLINKTVSNGVARPNTRNRPGQIFELDFGRQIGTNIQGNPATQLRVVLKPDGTVITAFPF